MRPSCCAAVLALTYTLVSPSEKQTCAPKLPSASSADAMVRTMGPFASLCTGMVRSLWSKG